MLTFRIIFNSAQLLRKTGSLALIEEASLCGGDEPDEHGSERSISVMTIIDATNPPSLIFRHDCRVPSDFEESSSLEQRR